MRNNSLDTFRLFASLAVIMLHVRYGALPPVAENNIRLLGRFAVPFFFLVSGYFFYINFQKNGDRYFTKTVQRLLGIFITACLIYTTIKFQKLSFSFSLLYDGTNLHLWFLSSMIFGLIICWYHYSYFQSDLVMTVLSVSIVLLSLLSDSYKGFFPNELDGDFCRYLLSVPYLYFGTVIARRKVSIPSWLSLVLIAGGIAMQMGEAMFLQTKTGYDPFRHQFLLGCIPYSFGMFFLSFNGFKNDRLAEWGRKYSLSIYVYHQFVNFFLFKAIRYAFGSPVSADIFIFSPLISFTVTLVSLMLIDRYMPTFFAILNGEIKMIPGLARQRAVIKIQNQ